MAYTSLGQEHQTCMVKHLPIRTHRCGAADAVLVLVSVLPHFQGLCGVVLWRKE